MYYSNEPEGAGPVIFQAVRNHRRLQRQLRRRKPQLHVAAEEKGGQVRATRQAQEALGAGVAGDGEQAVGGLAARGVGAAEEREEVDRVGVLEHGGHRDDPHQEGVDLRAQ